MLWMEVILVCSEVILVCGEDVLVCGCAVGDIIQFR